MNVTSWSIVAGSLRSVPGRLSFKTGFHATITSRTATLVRVGRTRRSANSIGAQVYIVVGSNVTEDV